MKYTIIKINSKCTKKSQQSFFLSDSFARGSERPTRALAATAGLPGSSGGEEAGFEIPLIELPLLDTATHESSLSPGSRDQAPGTDDSRYHLFNILLRCSARGRETQPPPTTPSGKSGMGIEHWDNPMPSRFQNTPSARGSEAQHVAGG